MSEAGGLASAVVVLGLIVLLANLVTPNTAWSNFSAAVQATPSFNNPFDERISHTLLIISDGDNGPGVGSVVNGGGVANCDASDEVPYWGCVTTADATGSYITLDAGDNQFNVDTDAISTPGGLPVLTAIATVQCRGDSGGTSQFQVSITGTASWFSETVTCEGRGGWGNTTITNPFVSLSYPVVSNFSGGLFRIVQSGGDLDVSFMSLTFLIGNDVECTSGDTLAYIGCQLGGFFSNVVRFFRLIVSAFVFIAQGFVYLGSIIFAFGGLFAVVFALGAPSPLQEIMDIAVIGLLLFIVFVFVKTARGTGPI